MSGVNWLCIVEEGEEGGGGQSVDITWTPASLDISPFFNYITADGLGGATSFIYSGTTIMGLSIGFENALTSISLPNLTAIDAADLESYDNQFINNPALVSFSAPNLTHISGLLSIVNDPLVSSINLSSLVSIPFGQLSINSTLITSLDLHSLVTAGQGLSIAVNAGLVSVDVSALVPTNTKNYIFSGNALNVSTVNLILHRAVLNAGYVLGTIDVSGGTSAAPAGQGIADKATLQGRGVFVFSN